MTSQVSDFDAAKAVTDQLKGMDKDRQERILRWVAESLGLVPSSPSAAAAVLAVPSVSPHRPEQLTPRSASKPVDIKSFVESKRPKSDVQFATVVAYYYKFEAPAESRKDAIDAQVLQDAARLAGRRRPPKPRMTLNNAKNLGYLDSPDRGLFRINSVGENLVAMTLPGGEATQPRQTKSPSKGHTSKKR